MHELNQYTLQKHLRASILHLSSLALLYVSRQSNMSFSYHHCDKDLPDDLKGIFVTPILPVNPSSNELQYLMNANGSNDAYTAYNSSSGYKLDQDCRAQFHPDTQLGTQQNVYTSQPEKNSFLGVLLPLENSCDSKNVNNEFEKSDYQNVTLWNNSNEENNPICNTQSNISYTFSRNCDIRYGSEMEAMPRENMKLGHRLNQPLRQSSRGYIYDNNTYTRVYKENQVKSKWKKREEYNSSQSNRLDVLKEPENTETLWLYPLKRTNVDSVDLAQKQGHMTEEHIELPNKNSIPNNLFQKCSDSMAKSPGRQSNLLANGLSPISDSGRAKQRDRLRKLDYELMTPEERKERKKSRSNKCSKRYREKLKQDKKNWEIETEKEIKKNTDLKQKRDLLLQELSKYGISLNLEQLNI